MNVHEYQAKEILGRYAVPIPVGGLARTPAEAEALARDLRGSACVVKAQIHAGGRGKAGGVRVVRSVDEAKAAAKEMLGSTLVTDQTGAEGRVVKSIYIEEQVEAARELYLAALVDRSLGRVALLASTAGGEDIEQAAADDPGAILRLPVDPYDGLIPDAARDFAGRLGLEGAQAEAAAGIMAGVYKAFLELDPSLIEINPLTVMADDRLLAVDVKMTFDDNALFRHPEIEALRDRDEVDPSELEAARYELNYVKLDGDIGCIVNGAGLALATIDILKQHGGEPADFMDVRPVATRQQVAAGFKMILANPKVKAVLVNVYGGGILRCDTIAEAIAEAVRETGLGVPLVVRAAGTNMEIAKKVLVGQGIPVIFADDMAEAAESVVKAARREAA
jgi:succinyl-CoA synthetase beta subunit